MPTHLLTLEQNWFTVSYTVSAVSLERALQPRTNTFIFKIKTSIKCLCTALYHVGVGGDLLTAFYVLE